MNWDDGVEWFTRRTVAPTDLPIEEAYVASQVLRLADETAEHDYLRACLLAATDAAEQATQRALKQQTWEMVLDRFPRWELKLERPPLISVSSLTYYDEDGAVQSLTVSPATFRTVENGHYRKASLMPLADETWPATQCRPDAVTVTYLAGYTDEEDLTFSLIKSGIALMVGEMYKQRTLSVHAVRNAPSVLDLTRFWRPVF